MKNQERYTPPTEEYIDCLATMMDFIFSYQFNPNNPNSNSQTPNPAPSTVASTAQSSITPSPSTIMSDPASNPYYNNEAVNIYQIPLYRERVGPKNLEACTFWFDIVTERFCG